MYRVVLYGLLVISAGALLLSIFGILVINPVSLVESLVLLPIICYAVNFVLGKVLKAPQNTESWLITALILFLLMAPPENTSDLLTLVLVGTLAMASKYILAVRKKHIFNPAAIATVVIGILGNTNSIWWVGSKELLPITLIVGLLIVRKIRRFRMFLTFVAFSLVTILITSRSLEPNILQLLQDAFTSWPLIFFGTVMLTEPLTTPPTMYKQIAYAAIVGVLFGTQFNIGPVYSTPQLALVLGNVFSYLVSPKQKLFLKLEKINPLAPDMFEFAFKPDQKLNFKAGQYLEWTLPHQKSDSRGDRRYFTIASSPTEDEIKLGVRINKDKSSSFKHSLLDLKPGDQIVASQLTGDFTLPEDPNKKLVFIAGGVGVTPFRSMVKYLVDTNQKRDIVLFHSSPTVDGFVYKDLFKQAEGLGLKFIPVLTGLNGQFPKEWSGKTGFITDQMLTQEVPDYKQRTYYLSGPVAMVDNYKKLLAKIGVLPTSIVTDYFPGF